MSFPCACGAVEPRHVKDMRPRCCWCHVVEDAGEPHPAHAECSVSAARIAPIKTRFQTAIRAEREACAVICETLDIPGGVMNNELRSALRRNPQVTLGRIVEALGKNLAVVIRARIG